METHDYVIVGSGSAGSVLANRLSVDPAVSVLVLEAGLSDRHFHVDTPAAFPKLFRSKRDWNYQTQPEPCCGGRQLYLPRGKMLGGSSSMNAMIYIRGNRADYDGWRDAGCEGWGYEDVLPYFKKAEHNERIRDEFHGTDGPLNVADLRSPNPLSLTFVEGAVEAGMTRNSDFNGAAQDGAGLYQVTQKRAARWSAAKAYLRPALDRENVTVVSGAHAERVVIESGRATGVRYRSNGESHIVRAEREVILAAGAFGTPHLLLLSGIGPPDHLREHDIDVVMANHNVGNHLQDHPVILMCYSVTQPVSLAHAEHPLRLIEYLVMRKGMLSSNVGEAGGFVRTDPAMTAPDIQFHFGPAYFIRHGFETLPGDGMTIGPTLVSPKSRGSLSLRSADPSIHPDIVTRALDHPDDVTSMIAGFRLGREIAASGAFAGLRNEEMIPGADVERDADIEAFLRQRVELLYHPSCTARMGPGPETAVVDPRLRVFGVDGLRVADASVMPTVVRGNTNAPTIMIAEKAADLIAAS